MQIVVYKKMNLLSTIMLLILGVILFTNPAQIVNFINYFVGIILVIMGIIRFLAYAKLEEKRLIDSLIPIILITIGVIVIIFSPLLEFAFRIILGAFILYYGITKLTEALKLDVIKKRNKIILISLAVVMILSGLYMIFEANLVLSMIGLIIIGYAIIDIVSYIVRSLNK